MAFSNDDQPSDKRVEQGIFARVEDYLDDKFQNAVDLENLDALLEDVLKQQGLLKQQVIDPCKSLVKKKMT